MVGTASAETFYLTNTSEKVNGENVPGIKVKVEFNGTHIIVTDESTSVDQQHASIVAMRLTLPDEYVLSVTDASANTYKSSWTHSSINNNQKNFAGFGDFSTLCDKNQKSDLYRSRGPIVIALSSSFNEPKLPRNSLGNSVLVHLQFGDNPDIITVGGKTSSWVGGGTEIPEFSTIVVPVSAILGLLFIFGRRKQE